MELQGLLLTVQEWLAAFGLKVIAALLTFSPERYSCLQQFLMGIRIGNSVNRA